MNVLCACHCIHFNRLILRLDPWLCYSSFYSFECVSTQIGSTNHKSESLKELADQRSGHGSAVAQEYLPLLLNHCILTQSLNVRTSALSLLSVILRQGLVHPIQTLPYLICLQTDPDSGNRSRATHLLAEAERKVPGFTAVRFCFFRFAFFFCHISQGHAYTPRTILNYSSIYFA